MKKVKVNWKRVTYYEVTDDDIIIRLDVFKAPMPLFHLLRKLAIMFDRLGTKTRLIIDKLTDTPINIEDSFKLPEEFDRFFGKGKNA